MTYLRYEADFLLFLRDSPLCTKPDGLPPAEEWMGPPSDNGRNQQQAHRAQHTSVVGAFDKFRNNDNALIDQTNRRPNTERHVSRNSATNPEDIVFGPPRTAFASSGRGGNKSIDNDKPQKDGEALGRFSNMRNRSGDLDSDRFRDNRNNAIRRRGEGNEQESEGWTSVKPRKSFGAEGAERFHGRMGGNFGSQDEKRQPRRDANDRTARPFDGFTRDREGDEEVRPRNGVNKNDNESWHKSKTSESRIPEKRERIDRAKNWRERDPAAAAAAAEANEQHQANRTDRNVDRRWGGADRRQDRDPEWFDEPVEPKGEARTQQDFQKWMEEMKGKSQPAAASASSAKANTVAIPEPSTDASQPPVQSAPATAEPAPDKFFMAFASKGNPEVSTPEQNESQRPKLLSAKSSRFTSFFSQPSADKNEPPVPPLPQAGAPPTNGQHMNGGLGALLASMPSGVPPRDEEKQAFAALLSKLQKQSLSATPPGPAPFAAPSQGVPQGMPQGMPQDGSRNNHPQSPFDALLGGERRDGPMQRPPQHEIHAPRPQQAARPDQLLQGARPEQILQDLVGHHQRLQNQGVGQGPQAPQGPPPGPPGPQRSNSNTEFLMNLMRVGPERSDSAMIRAVQQAQQVQQVPPPQDREPDFARDRQSQRQMRPGPPPGFSMDPRTMDRPMDEADFMSQPPTQILQRPPPPPGLDQMPPNWMPQRGMPPHPPQGQPPQRGPMMAPPGLPGGRNPPPGMPPMFPPNFPPQNMPHPDAMGLPRNMGPMPPGFFGQMPPGFLPPMPGNFGPGSPSEFVTGPGNPFDARGMPPQGRNFGR